MFLFGRPEDGPLTYPTWNTPGTNDVPTELLVGGEAVFDLDNDGKLDRVLRSSSETHYMHSAMLLVTKGDSATAPASFNFHKSSFLPCQLDNKNVQIHQCPPFGDGNEEVGLTVQVRPDQAFQFRTRYMSVVPFHYKERTYLGITSQSGERDVVAVLEPTPAGEFERTCLFQKVPEIF